MGYRSTVAYTIRFVPPLKDEPEKGLTTEYCKGTFFNFIGEAKSKEDTAGAFDDEDLKIDEDKLTIYFFASDVKWYDEYPDVKCHEALFELGREWADDDDGIGSNPYIGGVFVRLGENADDCVEDCFGQGDWDWCRPVRYIECDWVG